MVLLAVISADMHTHRPMPGSRSFVPWPHSHGEVRVWGGFLVYIYFFSRQVVQLVSFRTLVCADAFRHRGAGSYGLLLVKRCAHGPKHVAVALTGYISVCSVTSYHACNGGNCLHCHYISSAGASWPATMQKLPQGKSPCTPDACSRLTCSCSRGPSSTTSCLWGLPASELPPDPLPWLSCMRCVVPRGPPALEVDIATDTDPHALAWDGLMNRSLYLLTCLGQTPALSEKP